MRYIVLGTFFEQSQKFSQRRITVFLFYSKANLNLMANKEKKNEDRKKCLRFDETATM